MTATTEVELALGVASGKDVIVALDSKMLFAEQVDAFVELVWEERERRLREWAADGWTQTKIAKEVGRSQKSVSRWMERFDIKPSRPTRQPKTKAKAKPAATATATPSSRTPTTQPEAKPKADESPYYELETPDELRLSDVLSRSGRELQKLDDGYRIMKDETTIDAGVFSLTLDEVEAWIEAWVSPPAKPKPKPKPKAKPKAKPKPAPAPEPPAGPYADHVSQLVLMRSNLARTLRGLKPEQVWRLDQSTRLPDQVDAGVLIELDRAALQLSLTVSYMTARLLRPDQPESWGPECVPEMYDEEGRTI